MTMNRIVVNATVGSDGNLHLTVPVGAAETGTEVQVTVEPLGLGAKRTLLASDLMRSGLVGIWADRTDIGDSRELPRRLREQAQTRRRDS
jgi:hypothetical protein